MSKNNTKEVSSAALFHAMLSGENTEEAKATAEVISEMFKDVKEEDLDEYKEDEVEVEFVDEKKSEKKKRTSKKKDENFTVTQKFFGDCEYAKIDDKQTVEVTIAAHDMKYKEQRWPIPEKKVTYVLELIRSPQEAVRAVKAIYIEPTEQQIQDAYEGVVRYIKVVTYNTVYHKIKYLGFAEIDKTRNLNMRLNTKLMRESYMDANKVALDIKSTLCEMVHV